MNEIARVVHELATGEEGAVAPTHLTRLEQAALADLQSLLRLPPPRPGRPYERKTGATGMDETLTCW